jgi:hypothetical protein
MRNKDIDSKVKQAFSYAVPDIFDSVLSDCQRQKGKAVITADVKEKILG